MYSTLPCLCVCVLGMIITGSFSLFPPSTKSAAAPESSVVWSGGTCQRHVTIASNSLHTIKVFANFTKAGVYNLQNVKVWASLEGSSDYHIQRWQRTSLISIV